ncbi:MAG: fructose-6-phosphate aldolase, partial [Chlamydiia bacterium]|nr:fructose-6-phosphate aldolase [Chlamydiia bacterium]
MEIWLNTTDMEAIEKGVKMGFVSGITTNPTMVMKSKMPLED